MHGRPRKSKISEEDKEASASKAEKLRSLQSQFLQFHHSKTYTKETLELSVKLLKLNPEHYTAWNYRKLAIENCISTDPESIGSVLEEELKVVRGLVKQHLDSFNYFIGTEIRKIVFANQEIISQINKKVHLRYKDVRIGKPSVLVDGVTEELYLSSQM